MPRLFREFEPIAAARLRAALDSVFYGIGGGASATAQAELTLDPGLAFPKVIWAW
jgi:hypothetical protein